jgi:hypothetical protein
MAISDQSRVVVCHDKDGVLASTRVMFKLDLPDSARGRRCSFAQEA